MNPVAVAPQKMMLTPVHDARKPLRCTHGSCGGRLFLQTDTERKQTRQYLSCISCSREYDLTGKPLGGR